MYAARRVSVSLLRSYLNINARVANTKNLSYRTRDSVLLCGINTTVVLSRYSFHNNNNIGKRFNSNTSTTPPPPPTDSNPEGGDKSKIDTTDSAVPPTATTAASSVPPTATAPTPTTTHSSVPPTATTTAVTPADAPSSSSAPVEEKEITEEEEEGRQLLPRVVVQELDKYIIGQDEAKRAVAIALRNRWRRHQLPQPLRDEVIPKNILMIGPTGVGKTEVARRLAKLIKAPFIKVEATKFTEVGFHGRDVDQIIRDLLDVSIQNTRQRLFKKHQKQIDDIVNKRILEALVNSKNSKDTASWQKLLKDGALENEVIEVEMPEQPSSLERLIGSSGRGGPDNEPGEGFPQVISLGSLMDFKRSPKIKKLPISEARPILQRKEREKYVDHETLIKKAIHSAEQHGIVFIDEIDKICEKRDAIHSGADASSEGVQRDLLPIIEGSIVTTKNGNVDTSKILFIASGAFHFCKPSDLISELQGRLPIRVELKGLSQQDLYRILTEPENNQIKQQLELMKTEGVNLRYTDEAIREMARIASEVNTQVENIGARRLHTVIERVMEDISFNCDNFSGQEVVVDVALVKRALGDMLLKTDLSRFVL